MRPVGFRAVAVSLGVIAVAWLAIAVTERGRRERPNVLLVVMDTTRADRCSFVGYERPTTPRLAEFARDAVVFRDAWSPSGWTGPAHAALFTGLGPGRSGFQRGERPRLAGGVATLAEILGASGYATACFSNNNLVAPEFGLTRGFAKLEPLYEREHRSYPWAAETHALAAAWAEDRGHAGQPFFLFVNDMEPHMPYTPPAGDQRRFLRGDPRPEELASARELLYLRSVRHTLRADECPPRQIEIYSDLYDAEIAALDREIGALLDRLRAGGLLDSTVVVIAGDHGEMLGEHHMLEHAHTLYRAARHVPLLVRHPGTFDGGRTVDSLVRLEDVAPTLIELCGLSVPGGLDGISLRRDLGGRVSRGRHAEDPAVVSRFAGQLPGIDATPLAAGIDAVYDGRFHFVEHSDGRPVELYDVDRDPFERDNLAGGAPAEVARLRLLLDEPR